MLANATTLHAHNKQQGSPETFLGEGLPGLASEVGRAANEGRDERLKVRYDTDVGRNRTSPACT